MNPGNPPPMMTPPTSPMSAPAPRGSSPWKWILIGCGVLAFIGLLACGGCLAYGYYVSKDLIAAISSLEHNPKIEAEIGTYTVVHGAQGQVTNADQSITQTLQLRGQKGSGKVELTYKFESMKLKILSKVFI